MWRGKMHEYAEPFRQFHSNMYNTRIHSQSPRNYYTLKYGIVRSVARRRWAGSLVRSEYACCRFSTSTLKSRQPGIPSETAASARASFPFLINPLKRRDNPNFRM